MDRIHKLRVLLQRAQEEDVWDRLLSSVCGVALKDNRAEKEGEGEGEPSWAKESKNALNGVTNALNAHRQKRADVARRLERIVEKEQALADRERVQRKTAKHRERKRRRLLRREAESDMSAV